MSFSVYLSFLSLVSCDPCGWYTEFRRSNTIPSCLSFFGKCSPKDFTRGKFVVLVSMVSARWKTIDLSPQPAAQSSFKKIMVDWNLNFCPAKSLRPWWINFPSLILTCPLKVVRYWGDWDWDTSTSTFSHLSHPCYLSRPSRFSFRFRDNGGDGDKSSYKLSVFSLFPIIVLEVMRLHSWSCELSVFDPFDCSSCKETDIGQL